MLNIYIYIFKPMLNWNLLIISSDALPAWRWLFSCNRMFCGRTAYKLKIKPKFLVNKDWVRFTFLKFTYDVNYKERSYEQNDKLFSIMDVSINPSMKCFNPLIPQKCEQIWHFLDFLSIYSYIWCVITYIYSYKQWFPHQPPFLILN